MGYLFLVITLILFSIKGYCGKKTSGAIVSNSDSMIMNVLRMATCIVIGFVLVLIHNNLGSLTPTLPLLLVSALSGIGSAFFVVKNHSQSNNDDSSEMAPASRNMAWTTLCSIMPLLFSGSIPGP